MAFPIILVNASGGSDTAASGAGPSTALSGTTNAGTDNVDGKTVNLPSGTVLTGVATDGSHVVFILDTTAGARNFGKITGSSGSGGATPKVTVADAFTLNLSGKSWAIGGKRATIGSTTSTKLFDNNGSAGDAMPGWIVEMESGHTETIGGLFSLRRAGNTTDGGITLRGTGATRPVLSVSNDTVGMIPRGTGQRLEYFELASTGPKSTNSYAISTTASGVVVSRLKITTSGTNKWYNGIASGTGGLLISECEIGNTTSTGIVFTGGLGGVKVTGCYIHDTGSNGITCASGAWFGLEISDCIFDTCAGDGINFANTRTDDFGCGTVISGCTFYNCTSDGIEITTLNESNYVNLIESCIFSTNGGYGIRFSNGSATAAALAYYNTRVRNCNFFTNTSGKYLPTALDSFDESTVDPGFTDAPNGDFTIGTNLKALGFPLTGLGYATANRSYVDMGAVQRVEPTGGGGGMGRRRGVFS